MSLRKYNEDYKKKEIYLHEHEEYKKDLEFIDMIARDCKAWVEFYEREIKYAEDGISWKRGSLEYLEQHGRYLKEERRYLETKESLEKDLDNIIYSNQQILYWQKMADKWSAELKREKENFNREGRLLGFDEPEGEREFI